MNCRSGDLARVVPFDAVIEPHVGMVVRCIEPIRQPLTDLPGWVIEPELDGHDCVLDAALRPIRPGEVDDQDVRELFAPSVRSAAEAVKARTAAAWLSAVSEMVPHPSGEQA